MRTRVLGLMMTGLALAVFVGVLPANADQQDQYGQQDEYGQQGQQDRGQSQDNGDWQQRSRQDEYDQQDDYGQDDQDQGQGQDPNQRWRQDRGQGQQQGDQWQGDQGRAQRIQWQQGGQQDQWQENGWGQQGGQDWQQRNQQQRSQQGSQTQRQSRWQLQPQGWVLVGYDWDQDGTFDAYEYLSMDDLQRARRQSRQRMQQGQAQGGQQFRSGRQAAQQGRQMRQAQQRRQTRITGQIQDITRKSLMGLEGRQVFAKIQTQQGRTVRTLLGPQQNLQQLDLQEGDQVTVIGRRGTINDRSVLIAQRIQSNGQSVQVQSQALRQAQLKRYSGTIQQTRTISIQGQDQSFLVAKVQLDQQGQTVPVIFGPRQELGTSLNQGQQISILASTGQLNNKRVLVANQFSKNGQKFDTTFSDMGSRRFNFQTSGGQQFRQSAQQGGSGQGSESQQQSGRSWSQQDSQSQQRSSQQDWGQQGSPSQQRSQQPQRSGQQRGQDDY